MAAQVWLLLVLLGTLLVVALGWFLRSGDRVPAELAWWFCKSAALGLVGSFALHESAHVLLLKQVGSVTHIAVVRTALRISVIPVGAMTGWQTVRVALAGPGSCVVVGVVLWATELDPVLAWWYLPHGLLLLPFFGDGRSLARGLREVRRRAS
ncbi:hypothetical protein AB0A71_20160 [Kitasatospora aureofaciens]|uniref:hypothetical protein n=1 Tax=Kitasatospora aureofaciens TaxID=1894 RepID=UPI0033E725CE